MSADTVRPGTLRVRLQVSNVGSGMSVSAAGARRLTVNWAPARIVANQAQWRAEESYGIEREDRTRPFTFFDLVRE